jgi:hypothetical protein
LTELVLTILNEKAYSQGWQVFAGLWKKPVMEKTVPAKIVLQTFARWKNRFLTGN